MTIQHYIAAAKRFLTWVVAQDFVKNFDLGETDVKLRGGRGTFGKAYPHRKIDPNLAKILLYYDKLPLPKEPAPDDANVTNLARWQVRRRQIALLRNRAIVYVLFETGLRVSELVSLRRDQIDRALKNIPLPEDVGLEVVGKGGRRRTVWITRDSLSRIKKYLEARDDPSDVLFVGSKKGTPITRQMVWKIVTEGAEGAGVGEFTGPHAFRHWLARQLFNDEEDPVPMEDVQALLGHASPTTTRMIYAPHSSQSRLHKTIKRARKRPEDTIED
jgi:site-specific recombinase XerD